METKKISYTKDHLYKTPTPFWQREREICFSLSSAVLLFDIVDSRSEGSKGCILKTGSGRGSGRGSVFRASPAPAFLEERMGIVPAVQGW
ncbi:hypothetical protein CDAR_102361 [Caerostris darwini]|uniref:Uncharacterized protein n=1 Tax=Caerostris darwini TaxID=1538125 RepID=A0AAV4TUE2_9ARAC|nr:hypothetical protein CDAR_102361 [Caerostris darwini]